MGSLGTFALIMVVGAVLYLLFRGRGDPAKVVGAPKRVMSTESLEAVVFKCPLPKCPLCAGSADKMRQNWDGLKKVTWTCGYCGNASVQELKNEELPLSARRRLGMEVLTNDFSRQGTGNHTPFSDM